MEFLTSDVLKDVVFDFQNNSSSATNFVVTYYMTDSSYDADLISYQFVDQGKRTYITARIDNKLVKLIIKNKCKLPTVFNRFEVKFNDEVLETITCKTSTDVHIKDIDKNFSVLTLIC